MNCKNKVGIDEDYDLFFISFFLPKPHPNIPKLTARKNTTELFIIIQSSAASESQNENTSLAILSRLETGQTKTISSCIFLKLRT